MTRYTCQATPDDQAEIDAITPADAAAEYAADYAPAAATYWVTVDVTDDAGVASKHKIAINPRGPRCTTGTHHDWQSPLEVIGGLAENPGVSGHGGGVRIRTACARCGTYRVIDTWAQDIVDGEQGLESIAYAEPDDASLAWSAAQIAD